eukprot:2431187-Rhodomonas_salina.6
MRGVWDVGVRPRNVLPASQKAFPHQHQCKHESTSCGAPKKLWGWLCAGGKRGSTVGKLWIHVRIGHATEMQSQLGHTPAYARRVVPPDSGLETHVSTRHRNANAFEYPGE